MSNDPYQPPQATEPVVGVLSGTRSDLRKVADYQKGVLICILTYVGGLWAQEATASGFLTIAAMVVLSVGVGGAVFVFLLAMKLYGRMAGPLLGILTFVSLIGLFVLSVVSRERALAMKLAGNPDRAILGMLIVTLLVILLVINGKATNVLRLNGIQVGLLGARTSDL